MKAKVIVTHKPGVLDPQGQTVLQSLRQLGFRDIQDVRIGKYIEIDLEAGNRSQAEKRVAEISDKMLANPVIETFHIELE
ncbi:MAG: phosphoribosylformylglycinamidine synthase subunit PurS [bacterium]